MLDKKVDKQDRELTADELDLVAGGNWIQDLFEPSLGSQAKMYLTAVWLGSAAISGAATGAGR
jgi:hypothetical protein